MRLTVVGCSGSFPGPDSAASCYLLEADGFRVVIDLGNGALGSLARHVDIYDVDAVLLSHLHPDHCLDMCSYYVARSYRPGGPPPPIPVFGPKAAAQYLARAYGGSSSTGLGGAFRFAAWQPSPTRVGPLQVSAARVNHPGESYGIRIGHAGRVLCYSGDSGGCEALVELARDADLFLCEASFVQGRDTARNLHLSGREAAEHATRAGAARLVITHVPPWNDPQRAQAEARSAYTGPLDLARPGAAYDV